MPNLIETYARSSGLKIDRPWIKENFYPLPFDKYITLSAGSGQAAKNYDYYQIVINLLFPILKKYNIIIVQLGDKDTPLFSGTYDLRGKMNISQSSGVLKKALLHFGNDSWSAHAAGAFSIPLVALYGTTDKVLHGPTWSNKDKTILLESHRSGKKCSFGAEQAPNKTINYILPEDIANSILKLLELSDKVNIQTQFIGVNYLQVLFEVVPNMVPAPGSLPEGIPIVVRMDHEHNEDGLKLLLQNGYKIHLFVKQPVNLDIIAHYKSNILSYNHEIDENCPFNYIKIIERLISSRSFFSRLIDEEALKKLRFHFFDTCRIENLVNRTEQHFLEESATLLNKTIDKSQNYDKLLFRTSKYLLSKDKIYLSYSHMIKDQPTPSFTENEGKIINIPEFWIETNHQTIYKNE